MVIVGFCIGIIVGMCFDRILVKLWLRKEGLLDPDGELLDRIVLHREEAMVIAEVFEKSDGPWKITFKIDQDRQLSEMSINVCKNESEISGPEERVRL